MDELARHFTVYALDLLGFGESDAPSRIGLGTFGSDDRLYHNARRMGAIHPYASLITGYLDCHLLSSLPKVPSPILLVWGRHARPAPVEHSVRLLALAQNSRLEVVENAGAWVHDEQSAAVNRLIVRYLNDEIPTVSSAETA